MAATNIGFGDFTTEQGEIERRRRYAEALQAQSMQPVEAMPTPAGGFATPISWTQGLAKALQAYSGRKGLEKATEQQKALGERYISERSAALSDALKAGAAVPATPERFTGDVGDELYHPEVAARPADRAATYRALAASKFPEFQQIAIAEMLKAPEKVDGGANWLFVKDGQIVSSVPKTATPDARLRADTTLTTHQTPSGSAVLTNQGAMKRHAIPSGSAQLGAQTTLQTHATPSGSAVLGAATARRGQDIGANTAIRGQDIGASTARRGQDIGASTAIRGQDIGAATTRRGQDLGVNPAVQEAVANARAYGGDIGQARAALVVAPIQAAAGAQKILSAINYDPKTGKDDISGLIDKSTSGMLQNAVSQGYGAVSGDATTGRQAIGQLTTEANRIAMDMLNGKLGGGISNPDRDFIVGQLGDVANANIPAPERAAAWTRAMGRIKSLANPSGGTPTIPRPAGGGNPHSGKSDEDIKKELGLN